MLFSRSLLVIHFKYNRVYMITPKSLTIPSTTDVILKMFTKAQKSRTDEGQWMGKAGFTTGHLTMTWGSQWL